MLTAKIMKIAQTLQEGEILTAKSLLHLGSRGAINQALRRLANAGTLMRTSRGIYVLPVQSRFGMRGPDAAKMLEAVAKKTNEPIVRHGAAAANAFGLTTQVPVREIWVTAGRTRQFQIGNRIVLVQHAPRWQMLLPNKPAGDAIRAIAWIGKARAEAAVKQIKRHLPKKDWAMLVEARPILPIWIAAAISEAT
jgi:hypothetical protein